MIFLFGLPEAFAQDFGGSIENITGLLFQDPFGLSQKDKVSLWFDSGDERPVAFTARGSYTFTPEVPVLLNVDEFVLKCNADNPGNGLSRFGFDLGRFTYSEFSGEVLSHVLDGFNFRFEYPVVDVSAGFGFSGILFKPTSTLLLSKRDYAAWSDTGLILAPPRLIGAFEADFGSLFLRQTMHVSALFQVDIPRFDTANAAYRYIEEGETVFDPSRGGRLSTQYFGLGFEGPLIPGLFWNGYGYLNTGRVLSYIDGVYTYKPIMAFLAGIGVRYYWEALLSSLFSFTFEYSSGDPDQTSYVEGNTSEWSNQFIPLSATTRGALFSPRLGNIFFMNIEYSMKPFGTAASSFLNSLQPFVKAWMFFRSTEAPISESGLLPTASGLYLGTEANVGVNYRPFSDLGVALTGGLFLPNASVFAAEKGSVRGILKIEVSFSF